jgi:alpha-glucosidase
MAKQKSIILRPGKISEYTEQSFGFEGVTENNITFRITVFSEYIIRVQMGRSEFDEHSYAVVSTPESPSFSLDKDKEFITLKTGQITMTMALATSEITFSDKKGKILNQDEPGLGVSWIGEQVTAYKTMQPGERFVGLGEKVGPLDRKGHGYQHWNTDSFAYGPGTDPLYCSIPFYMGIHENTSYGIFMDNSHKSFFNFGASNNRFSSFSADQGDMNYYFIHDQDISGILQAYTWLTGRMSLPPLWSLGYQQCRYSYYPEAEVKIVADTFRHKDIPADAIVMDIHYMDKYKIFSWDPDRFPDPKAMIDYLKSRDFRIVVMCDPGIKVEEGYAPYETGLENDIFLKYPDGEPYQGEVWPGWCHFPDFTKPEAREWWKKQLPAYVDLGIDGYWNDMNEIATWGQMIPENVLFDFEGDQDTMRKGRNVYGLCMARSTYEATKALMNKRPFNLTRSAYAGIQRYAAVWTGDNVATDEHMLLGVRLVNSMGLTGISYAGYDVGGFAGNASEHLFARWIQTGAFSPFFRGHSMVNSRDSEPWAFGEEVEQVSRNYIRLRYKLMMYLYSAFYESSQTGLPVSRSLVIDYGHDPKIYDPLFENQYLFGQNILIAPHESTKNIIKVYLPAGEWYDFFTNEKFNGNQTIYVDCPINKLPVFIKASATLPVCPEIGNSTNELGDLLEWHVFKGSAESTYVYYEDDGESFNNEKGDFLKRVVTYNPDNQSLVISEVDGSFNTRFSRFRLVLHGFSASKVIVDGKDVELEVWDYRFIDPIPSFDPLFTEIDESLDSRGLRMADLPLTNKEMIIRLK